MSDPKESAPEAAAISDSAGSAASSAEAATPEAPAAEAPKTEAPAADKPPPAELTPDIVHNALRWYATAEHAKEDDALATLAELRVYFTKPEFGAEAVAAVRAVSQHVLANPELPPAVNAQMTLLLAQLLAVDAKRDDVDAIYAAWVRHASSFGPRPTPNEYQRESWIQRLGDLIGWGSLDVNKDREALGRFTAWLDEWSVKNKFRAKRSLDLLRRMFPSDVWKGVHFPPAQGHNDHGHGHGHGHGHNRPAPRVEHVGERHAPAEGAAAEGGAAADGATTAAGGEGAASPGGDNAARPEGQRKKRRRKKRRGGAGANPAAPGAAAAGGAEVESSASEGDGDADEGGDEGGEAGEPNFNR